MIKIWGKLLTKDKIIKDATIEIDESGTTFFEMLQNLSHELNVPTPVLLDKHVYDFNLFHMCTFKKDDFVEKIIFDKLELCLIN